MGEFNAGAWIAILSVYFFALFLVVYSIINAFGGTMADISTIGYKDPGYLTQDPYLDEFGNVVSPGNVTASIQSDISTNQVLSTIGVLTGFGSDSVQLGIPSIVAWIIRFLAFYVPMFMLLFSTYMILPFMH